jgi:hypothetical protein
MAAIALTTAGRIEVIRSDPAQQRTLRASVAIAAGQPSARTRPASGRWRTRRTRPIRTAPYLALKAVPTPAST